MIKVLDMSFKTWLLFKLAFVNIKICIVTDILPLDKKVHWKIVSILLSQIHQTSSNYSTCQIRNIYFITRILSCKSDGTCATMDKLLRVTCLGCTSVLLYLSSWCGTSHGQFPRVCVGNATKANATCCPTPPGSPICLLNLQEEHLLLTGLLSMRVYF